jgi:hypothetical protein
MGCECSRREEMKNLFRILAGKREGKIPLESDTCRWEVNRVIK